MTFPQALDTPTDDGEITLFERFDAMLCTATFDGRFLEVNPALERALGYGPGELTNSSFTELAHRGDQREIALLTAEFLDASAGLSFEFRCLRKDGSSCPMAWNVRADM